MARKLYLIALLTVIAAGCQKGESIPADRVLAKGTVTVDGTRIPVGEICFVKLDDKGDPESGDAEIAVGIAEGKFEAALKPGKHQVQIRQYLASASNDPETPAPRKQVLPEKYNDKSELVTEVSLTGPNELNYALDSKHQ